VSEADNELTRSLECLRLASDFMEMSRDTLNPALHAHCVRMASYWSDRGDGNPDNDDTSPDNLG
jgi:hypothetical protein